jgi:hypothetical protein
MIRVKFPFFLVHGGQHDFIFGLILMNSNPFLFLINKITDPRKTYMVRGIDEDLSLVADSDGHGSSFVAQKNKRYGMNG